MSEVEAVLQIKGLEAFYGDSQALFGLDLEVRQGEIVALVGRNGAGKTTTFRSLMGFSAPRVKAQQLRFGEWDLSRMPTHKRVQAGLGFVPEDRRIFVGLSVQENLKVAQSRGENGKARELVYSVFPVLKELASRRGDYLSGGQQQMLTIARTLMTGPRLILLDEPTEGLAPVVVAELMQQLQQLKAEGIAILLAEQNLRFTRQLCDRAYVLESGAIRYQGTAAELDRDEAVWQAHLSL